MLERNSAPHARALGAAGTKPVLQVFEQQSGRGGGGGIVLGFVVDVFLLYFSISIVGILYRERGERFFLRLVCRVLLVRIHS